jgi:hypothetical protein
MEPDHAAGSPGPDGPFVPLRSLIACLRRGRVDVDAHRSCDLPVPLTGRVLVDHRCPHAAVAHPRHQLLRARASDGRQVVPGVPEVVEVHAPVTESSVVERAQPQLAEVVPTEPATERADEHETVRALLSELADVPCQLGDDRGLKEVRTRPRNREPGVPLRRAGRSPGRPASGASVKAGADMRAVPSRRPPGGLSHRR